MAWGRNNESTALERYNSEIGHKDIVVTQLGLWISPDHPASPDAAAYDPLATSLEININCQSCKLV